MKKIKIIIVLVLALSAVVFFMIFSDDENTSTENKEISKQTESPIKSAEEQTLKSNEKKNDSKKADNEKPKGDYFVSDDIYKWDERQLKWVLKNNTETTENQANSELDKPSSPSEPIKLEWYYLDDIQYKLRYFQDLDFEAYAPVFGETLKSLNGEQVIIEGFVIPLFEDKEPLALSANPYASCFFCGQASPASVMSMYMKNKGTTYKADDYKTFKGKLYLNYDDPNEFYYILKDAVEIDQNP